MMNLIRVLIMLYFIDLDMQILSHSQNANYFIMIRMNQCRHFFYILIKSHNGISNSDKQWNVIGMLVLLWTLWGLLAEIPCKVQNY